MIIRYMQDIEKWSVLAFLRFILAGIVAVNHLGDYTELGMLSFIPQFGAFEAILGFLVISGYSIAESYSKNQEGFYERRIKRIYPIYIASIIITLIVTPPTLSVMFCAVLLVNLLFLNQLFTAQSLVGPAWSLSLEIWLYGCAPFLSARKERTLLTLASISFVFFAFYTCARSLLDWPYYSGLGYGVNFIALSYMWILGYYLSIAQDKARAVNIIGFFMAFHLTLSGAIQCAYRLKNGMLEELPADLLSLGFSFILIFSIWFIFRSLFVTSRHRTLRSTTMRYLGDISYPLYLVHIPVYKMSAEFGFRNPYLLLLYSLGLSSAIYWGVDQYSQKRHLPTARTPRVKSSLSDRIFRPRKGNLHEK